VSKTVAGGAGVQEIERARRTRTPGSDVRATAL
jgi:hypothetical protein